MSKKKIELVELCNRWIDALQVCPWAKWMVHIRDGIMCFESYRDYMRFVNECKKYDDPFFVTAGPAQLMQVLLCGGNTNCRDCVNEPICYKFKS